MTDAASQLYASLSSYSYVENLIANGESEGLYLECKSPGSPQLTRDIKSHLAKAISGFSNTAGGIVIWGLSTTRHEHSNLDILSQIEPIANCKQFARHIDKSIPSLTVPSIINYETKIILKSKTDTRGIIVTFIPQSLGGPIQSIPDNLFYFRCGDEFIIAPYEMIKRLFSATDVPDLHLIFNDKLVKLKNDGNWEIPIAISNQSSASAENSYISIEIDNPLSCEEINITYFMDASGINPGKKIYMRKLEDFVHKGLDLGVGTILVKMKVGKRPKRLFKFTTSLYANKMRARSITATIQLAKKGFSIRSSKEVYLY